MNIPIDIINVVLSYRKPTEFTKKGNKFKQGNTDFTLTFETTKDDAFNIGSDFTIIFVNERTEATYEITSEYYSYDELDGTITIPAISNFVAQAGRYSFIIMESDQYSYKASYKVETGNTEVVLEDLPEFSGQFIKNVIEEPAGTYTFYYNDNSKAATLVINNDELQNQITENKTNITQIDSQIKEINTSVGNLSENVVNSWNGLNGTILATAASLPFISIVLEGEDPKEHSTEEALNYILDTMITPEQLNMFSLTDVIFPNDKTKAYRPYLDTDQITKYSPLVQIGENATEEVLIFKTETQKIQSETDFTEITFQSATTSGTHYVKNGNGIQINDLTNEFELTAIINYSFSNVWLTYPITLELRLMKNGIETGLMTSKEITSQSGGTLKITGISKNVINGLASGDILTLETRAYDSDGNYGSGSWSSFAISTSSNFSIYYRSITSAGFADPIENSFAKRFIINKTDSATIAAGSTVVDEDNNITGLSSALNIVSFSKPTEFRNTDTIEFNEATNAVIITASERYAYNLNVSLPILRTNAGGNTDGKLMMLANLEYREEETAAWEQYNPYNNGRILNIGNEGLITQDYHAYLNLEKVGQYRLRIYWLNIGSGALQHKPQFFEAPLTGVLSGSATYDLLGRLELIGQPIS